MARVPEKKQQWKQLQHNGSMERAVTTIAANDFGKLSNRRSAGGDDVSIGHTAVRCSKRWQQQDQLTGGTLKSNQ